MIQEKSDIGFWKNLFLATVFLVVTPITIGVSLFSLLSLKSNATKQKDVSGSRVYASLPKKVPSVVTTVSASDARPEIIRQYLQKYESPLTPYADNIVQISDKYSLDFRLLTAIAQQESNLCKIIPPGSYNCWGWGITSVGTLGFRSYVDGLETVAQGLRQEYLGKGYSSVKEIMGKYTPLSNGSWAEGVSYFMSQME